MVHDARWIDEVAPHGFGWRTDMPNLRPMMLLTSPTHNLHAHNPTHNLLSRLIPSATRLLSSHRESSYTPPYHSRHLRRHRVPQVASLSTSTVFHPSRSSV